MIIMKIQGGLGNQMFQYAFGRNLSLIHKVPLKIDCSYLKELNQSGRQLQLDKLNIQATGATKMEIQSYTGFPQKILDRFWRKDSDKKHIREINKLFDANILKHADGYFDGHWQNEKYFKENENIIRKDFELKNSLGPKAVEVSEKISSTPNTVSVHIRRGDYVSIKKITDTHGVLPLSYYEQAMKKILETAPDAHFFISSDDIAWVKENFPKKYPVTFASSPEISDCEELILMSRCRHNIIANSTFSWWGAWLNRHSDKIVVSPLAWKKNASEEQNPSLPNWLKL